MGKSSSSPMSSSPGGETLSLLSNTTTTNSSSATSTATSREDGGGGGDHDGHQFFHHHHGSATVMETILNEANTCMGTGCLALPFAARLGGIFLHVGGIVAIAMWNVYSVHRLCQCLYLLPKDAVLYEKDILTTGVVVEEPTKEHSTALQTKQQEQEEEEDYALELSPPSHHHHHIDSTTTTRPIHRQSFDETEATTTLPFGDASTSYVNTRQHPSYSSTTTTTTTTTGTMLTTSPQQPPRGTSTYSRVAWYAFGPVGLLVLDILMIVLFLGVVVTFINAIRGFLRDTPFTTGHDALDAIGIAFILGPMSSVKDMGYLSKASATGIVALFLSFTVIATYGLFFFQQHDNDNLAGDATTVDYSTNDNNNGGGGGGLNWFPENGMEGVSTWFGSTVFGYGVAPLTYNFLESMAQPQHMVPASTMALLIVAIAYVVIGVGIYSLFPNDVDGDILRVLPAEGWLPTLTRLSMAVVVSVTAPLLIVPCGQLVEGKILKASAVSNDAPYYLRATVRIGIALLCVSISVLVPGFVSVLSLVGCASVATVGFVVPPALFLRLRILRCPTWTWDLTFDAIMLLWGIVATGITTSYTFEGVMSSKV